MLTPEDRDKSHMNRSIGLRIARRQFQLDLQKDAEYLEFKRRSTNGEVSYGIPVATDVSWMINRIPVTTERLIKDFITK